jgi:ATP-binding cassette subfamily B protein
LNYQHFLDTVTRNIRKSVIEEAATHRTFALERHALTLQQPLLQDYQRVSESLMRDEIRLAHRSTAVRLSGRAAAGIGLALAYALLALLLYAHVIDLSLAGTAVLAMRTASSAVTNAIRDVNSLYENSYSIDFFTKLLAESAQRRPHHRHDVIAAPPAPETISLDQVSFTYPGQTDPAITDVSLTIRRGQTIALVGENGSGKTTLAKLIVGLYPPTIGEVTWDGVGLRNAHEHSIHSQIGVISQEPATWPMTAARNILIGRYHQGHRDDEAWTNATSYPGHAQIGKPCRPASTPAT